MTPWEKCHPKMRQTRESQPREEASYRERATVPRENQRPWQQTEKALKRRQRSLSSGRQAFEMWSQKGDGIASWEPWKIRIINLLTTESVRVREEERETRQVCGNKIFKHGTSRQIHM